MAEREHDAISAVLRRLPRYELSASRTETIRARAHAELRAQAAAKRRPLLRAAVLTSEILAAAGYGVYVLGKLATLLSLH